MTYKVLSISENTTLADLKASLSMQFNLPKMKNRKGAYGSHRNPQLIAELHHAINQFKAH